MARKPILLSWTSWSAVLLLVFVSGLRPARSQVLAQRNWAGSGVTVEPWWRRAVFYRIDPARFQDSNGDGKGDLAGVVQRLDYVQMLGVDALILKSAPVDGLAVDGFDDLVRSAAGSHVRVLVELGAPASQGDDARYVAEARQWLNQGAAGLYVPTRLLERVDGAGHIGLLLHQLRALTDSFPGGRVLLADRPSTPDPGLLNALARETQLTATRLTGTTAGGLRAELMAALGEVPADAGGVDARLVKSSPTAGRRSRGRRPRVASVVLRHAATGGETGLLLEAERVPGAVDGGAKAGLERALAVMVLASRSAVVLEYGQELGLEAAGTAGTQISDATGPLMQWTPSNLTRAPKLEVKTEETAVKPEGATYEGFQAFIRPLRKDFFPPPPMPVVVESDEVVPVAVDPSTLPGFTVGEFDAALAAANGATANVAMEQADPASLLNLYKQLIELHLEKATVRNGAEAVRDYDALDAVVWVRRAPASSRTSATVVVACNLSDKPVVLGGGVEGLRSLLRPGPVGEGGGVAPFGVLVGEGR